MSYEPTIWVNEVTPLNADNMNKIEQGIKTNTDNIATSQSDISNLDNTKLDKVISETNNSQAYIKNANGSQGMLDISNDETSSNTLVKRNGQQIKVPLTPSQNNDATSKKYVDDEIKNFTNIFYCTQQTTFTEITEAIQNNKWPVLVISGQNYYLTTASASAYQFSRLVNRNNQIYTIDASNNWTFGSVTFETTGNKVVSLSNASTDTQYPSAKCVYDAIQNVTIPIDDQLSDSSENPVQNKVVTNALAGKQGTLSSAQLDAVNSGIDSTKVAQITTNTNNITTINSKIPSQASSENQLADKDFVNSTINSLSAFYITYDVNKNPFPTLSDLLNAQTYYYNGEPRVPTQNDYALVVSDATHDGASCRYIYQGSWTFQFIVNETPFTAAQIAAINSGITEALTNQITTNQSNITNLQTSKQDLITSTNKLSADLVDDTNTTNKFVTSSQRTKIDNAVQKTGDENIYGLKTFDQRPKVGINPDLPQAYQLLDYIEGTGSQYISTGTHSDGSRTVTAEIAFTDVTSGATQILVGGRPLNSGVGMGYIALRNNHLAYLTGGTWKESSFTPVLNQKYTVSCYQGDGGPQSMSVNGTNILSSSEHAYGNTKTNYLFAFNNQDSAQNYMKAKLYSCKIYEGSSLVRNFVPCLRLSDNKTGMFDRVSNTFYANQTITEFTTGTIDTDASLVALKSDIEANPTLIGTEDNLTSIKLKGTNYKIDAGVVTVNGQSGSVTLDADDISDGSTTNKFVTASEKTQIGTNATNISNLQTSVTNLQNTKQDTLISGTTLKTINNQSLLGSGNIDVSGGGGGTGITNYQVIDRTSSLPTATATSPDFVQINGKLYQKKITQVSPSTITDLSGTTWVFNNILDFSDFDSSQAPYYFYINFESNETNFEHLLIQYPSNEREWEVYYNGSSVYLIDGWQFTEDKTISIIDGTDVTNTDLIDWLKNNATLQTTAYSYEEVGSGSVEGLPLGFIFSSVLPQSNLNYHLLNGDSLLIADYGDFYTVLTTLISQNWSLSCTANEYAEDIAKTGNCGKFVINSTNSDITGTYDSTTITVLANSFKLPTITKFIQGLSSLANLGESLEAGLPNITGGYNTGDRRTHIEGTSGALYKTRVSSNTWSSMSSNTGNTDGVGFDASLSNSIYGNSSTVQPQSTMYPYYMVVKNNNSTGLISYLNNLAQAGVQSIGGSVGVILLGDKLEIINNQLNVKTVGTQFEFVGIYENNNGNTSIDIDLDTYDYIASILIGKSDSTDCDMYIFPNISFTSYAKTGTAINRNYCYIRWGTSVLGLVYISYENNNTIVYTMSADLAPFKNVSSSKPTSLGTGASSGTVKTSRIILWRKLK